ncbi:MAG: right-handed parallel beta-helix repeat-containing protein, partial [Pseudomonadota bacterium]
MLLRKCLILRLAFLLPFLTACNSFQASDSTDSEKTLLTSPIGNSPSDQVPPTDSEPNPEPVDPPSNGVVDICDPEYVVIPDESEFDNVLKDFDRTSTLRLEGSEWDNTLIKDCHIHDTSGDGIFLKNVKNVMITGCTFEDIDGQAAIRTSSTGGSDNVVIFNNAIKRTADNGISIPQRFASGINSTRILIHSNSVEDSGLDRDDGKA